MLEMRKAGWFLSCQDAGASCLQIHLCCLWVLTGFARVCQLFKRLGGSNVVSACHQFMCPPEQGWNIWLRGLADHSSTKSSSEHEVSP